MHASLRIAEPAPASLLCPARNGRSLGFTFIERISWSACSFSLDLSFSTHSQQHCALVCFGGRKPNDVKEKAEEEEEEKEEEGGGGQLASRQFDHILNEKSEEEVEASYSDLISVSVEKTGQNKRRFTVSIPIEAPLEAVWNVLTDYEGLAEFLPGLAVCELLERWENGARLFQIGEQNLTLGLKFQAKGVINVYENSLKIYSCGISRDIDFEMIEGDFKVFKGTWRMEQETDDTSEISGVTAAGFTGKTILTYMVDVQPKVWLPVSLVENRLSKEVQTNLVCVRDQVLKCHTSMPASSCSP